LFLTEKKHNNDNNNNNNLGLDCRIDGNSGSEGVGIGGGEGKKRHKQTNRKAKRDVNSWLIQQGESTKVARSHKVELVVLVSTRTDQRAERIWLVGFWLLLLLLVVVVGCWLLRRVALKHGAGGGLERGRARPSPGTRRPSTSQLATNKKKRNENRTVLTRR